MYGNIFLAVPLEGPPMGGHLGVGPSGGIRPPIVAKMAPMFRTHPPVSDGPYYPSREGFFKKPFTYVNPRPLEKSLFEYSCL